MTASSLPTSASTATATPTATIVVMQHLDTPVVRYLCPKDERVKFPIGRGRIVILRPWLRNEPRFMARRPFLWLVVTQQPVFLAVNGYTVVPWQAKAVDLLAVDEMYAG